MHIKLRKVYYSLPLISILILSNGCGGGSSSDNTDITPPANPPVTPPTMVPPTNPPTIPPVNPTIGTTSADLISSRGVPLAFTIDCDRYAFNISTGDWQPQEGLVRLETWFYKNSSGSDVFTMLNGEVIRQTIDTNDISQYPPPNIDPRRFGCGENISTVVRVLNGTQILTTENSDVEDQLNLGNVQLKSVYYSINNAKTGVSVTYTNDKLLGMVTL